MELKRIPITQIQPNPNNPRRDLGDIKAFAKTFKLNAQYPGEPYTPIIVVPDGNMFTIADGERRYEAMLVLGTKECNAMVCEDFEQADSLAAMLATNDKKALTEVERSIGVQQMLILGVDPKTVETAGGLKKGEGKKMKKAMESIDEAFSTVTQATIDQILKAQEIKEIGGDDSAVASVLEADPGEWEGAYKGLKREIEQERALEEFCDALDVYGIALMAKPSESVRYDRMFKDSKELSEFLEGKEPEEGWVFVYAERTASVDLYVPASKGHAGKDAVEADGSNEITEPSKVVDVAAHALIEGAASRMRWYVLSCKHGTTKTKRLRATMHVDKAIESHIGKDSVLRGFLDSSGVRDDSLAQGGGLTGLAGAYCASYASDILDDIPAGMLARLVKDTALREGDDDTILRWVEWVEAFMHDGWRMEDDERLVYEIACERLKRRPYDDGGKIGKKVDAPAIDEAAVISTPSISLDIDSDLGTDLGTQEAGMSELPDEPISASDLVFA